MRFREIISEAPISNWEVDPDLHNNEKEMVSKFHGYEREGKHWSDSDKHAITHEPTIEKIKQRFLKVPYDFNFYFWQSTDPDYDPISNIGVVNDQWVVSHMGENVLKNLKTVQSPNSITIVFTGNMSDEYKINMHSPWIVGHRVAHCFLSANNRNEQIWDALHGFENFIETITKYAYGVSWPSQKDYSQFSHLMRVEITEIYSKILGSYLGTMASARNNKLVTPYEWYHETFTQWLLQGGIKLNELPAEIHPDETLTTDPRKLAKAKAAWAKFPQAMSQKFDAIMKAAEGQIWIM